jgi:hypothetical protein
MAGLISSFYLFSESVSLVGRPDDCRMEEQLTMQEILKRVPATRQAKRVAIEAGGSTTKAAGARTLSLSNSEIGCSAILPASRDLACVGTRYRRARARSMNFPKPMRTVRSESPELD